MSRYWILCISEDNYSIAKELGLIGMSERGRLGIRRISIGDKIVFYISKKKVDSDRNDHRQRVYQFYGIVQVSGQPFESNDLIWHIRPGELFPHRRKVEFLLEGKVNIKPLLEKLSFVTNTAIWGVRLRQGYLEITRNDFEIIEEAMRNYSLTSDTV